jgi:hypothetical protein
MYRVLSWGYGRVRCVAGVWVASGEAWRYG